jgi:hypothetical protein
VPPVGGNPQIGVVNVVGAGVPFPVAAVLAVPL